MPTTEAVGLVPAKLMAMMNRHLAEALEARGFQTQGAGGLIYFNAVRGLLTELGMLPGPANPEDLASTLTWQAQSAILRLGDVAAGHEIPAAGWVELAKLPNLLRETAAQVEMLVSLYEEGK